MMHPGLQEWRGQQAQQADMNWHLILAILASFLPPLLFLTHLRGMVTYWYNLIHMVASCAQQPFKHSNPGTCQLAPRSSSTAAAFHWPQVLSARASARASSKSSASTSTSTACQVFLKKLPGLGFKMGDWLEIKASLDGPWWHQAPSSTTVEDSRWLTYANFVHCNTMQDSHFAMSWFSTPCTHLWSNTIPA